MPDPVRIFVSGYYGYANPGDEAILTVILSELRAHLPNVAISVISGTPEETAATHRVTAVLWSDALAITQAVRQSDLVITGGGGIFHDYGGFPEDGLLTEGNWGLGFHVTAGLLAALFEKPLILYAVGVGPLFSEAGRRFTRAICAAASSITVRDPASRQLLEEIGVPPNRVRVTADPAFLFLPAPSSRAQEILAAEAVPATSLRIGVTIRHWAHHVSPEQWETELAAGLDLFLDQHSGRLPSRARQQAVTQAQVVFLPFQQFPGEQEDDLAVALRVSAKMRHPGAVHVLHQCYTPAEKAALLASCHAVAAMRLHSLIFCIRAGVPFVALTYDEKVRQIVKRTGLDSLAIDMPHLHRGLIAAKLQTALETPPVDPSPLITLARENTSTLLHVLAQGPAAAIPLHGEPLALVQSAVMALLTAQKRLRASLADQKINYEYQLRTQREEHRAILQHQLATSTRDQTSLQHQLAQSERQRTRWETSASDLENRHAALRTLHERTTAEYEAYAREMTRRLTLYRGQRFWRAMLACRKAYVLLTRQGWSGRLRFFPWLLTLLAGGGNLETEQLDFPAPPKPRG